MTLIWATAKEMTSSNYNLKTELTDFYVLHFDCNSTPIRFFFTRCNSPFPLPPTPSQHCCSSHSPSDMFFGKDDGWKIGGIYMKAIYKEYTDDTFTTLKPAPDHLGLFGEESV